MNKDYTILVVDDEEDIIELLSYNLKKEGFTVHTASDGKMAIKKAKEIIKMIYVVNETIAMMLTARINTPRYMNLPPNIKAIAAGVR